MQNKTEASGSSSSSNNRPTRNPPPGYQKLNENNRKGNNFRSNHSTDAQRDNHRRPPENNKKQNYSSEQDNLGSPKQRRYHNKPQNSIFKPKIGASIKDEGPENGWQCVVCCQRMSPEKAIFAIGPCDHLVCYQCSTKMRVLCEQIECPICRQDIPEVIFTTNQALKYSRLETRKCIQYNSRYKIYFESEQCLDAFNKLLEHRCSICNHEYALFDTLAELELHLKREHDMFLCELCVQHLKVFCVERKYYTRKNLARHKDIGDQDNRSHRGHPLCRLCDTRFMDEEDLIRHLKRDHYYCHFCNPDASKEYYANYDQLRNHFRDAHFLCETGACRDEKFLSVFRSELDMQAHFVQNHCTSKNDLKNARILHLDLNVQRNQYNPNSSSISFQQNRNNHRRNDYRSSRAETTLESTQTETAAASASVPQIDDFPQLPVAPPQPIPDIVNGIPVKKKTSNKKGFSARLDPGSRHSEEFPSLEPTSSGLSEILSSSSFKKAPANNFKYQSYRKDLPKNENTSAAPSTSKYSEVFRANASNVGISAIRERDFPMLPNLVIKKNKKKGKAAKQAENKPINYGVIVNKANETDQVKNDKKEEKLEATGGEEFPGLEDANNKQMLRLKVPPGLTKGGKKKSFSEEAFQGSLDQLAKQLVEGSLSISDSPSKSPKDKKKPIQVEKKIEEKKIDKIDSLSPKTINEETKAMADKSLTNGNNRPQKNYIFPADFDERNSILLRLIKQSLRDNSQFGVFKGFTDKFRRSQIDGITYYKKCSDLFGPEALKLILSELLVLMPHVGKQNELLSAYERQLNESKGAIPKSRVQRSVANGVWTIPSDERIDILVCPKCQQVLAKKDGADHMNAH